MKSRVRIDQLLVRKGLAQSREKARALIMAGVVEIDRVRIDKPGRLVSPISLIGLKETSPPYASRGGLKLAAALKHFHINIADKTIMDVGASTGGFTDCLLKQGAGRIIAVDVGYGQLDWQLRQDKRVHVMERTNIRYLTREDIKEIVHGAVIDVSFISLRLVVPPVSDLLTSSAFIIALIKPQFEVGKGKVGKGGIVRDPKQHIEVIETLTDFFKVSGWQPQGYIPSPVRGAKGNQEFLIYLAR